MHSEEQCRSSIFPDVVSGANGGTHVGQQVSVIFDGQADGKTEGEQ